MKTDELAPTLLQDSREQTPLIFPTLKSIVASLPTGDYSIAGMENEVCLERKSLADFIACVGVERDRFMRECHRLMAYPFRRIIIVGERSDIEQGNYRSKMSAASILATITTIEVRYNIPIIFTESQESAALIVETYARYLLRERVKVLREILEKNG